MKAYTFAIAGLGAFCSTLAMNWGDMSQYKGRLSHKSPPQLQGTTVWLSGRESEGFDVVLSPDAHAKVKGILEACGTEDNKCFQDVLNTLESSSLEIDNKIKRRDFVAMLSKTATGNQASGFFAAVTAILYTNWKLRYEEVNGYGTQLHIPIHAAESAAKEATGTTVVHSAGSMVITVTPTARPSTLTGSVAPAITTAAADDKGHKKGDLIATLDENLARKINEVAHRMTDCEDGRNFDATHGSRRRGNTATYGQALCAAEGVIGMSAKGGTFADLTLLSHDKIGIEFATNAGKAKDALVVLKDFIIAYSPMLAVPEQLAEELGTYLLAIIIDTLVIENIPIGPMNYIGPDLAITYDAMSKRPRPTSTSASATSSSSGCPDPTKTPLACGLEEGSDCDAQFPNQLAKEKNSVVCANSKWKGCKCSMPAFTYENVMGKDEYKGMQIAFKLFKELKDHPPVRKAKVSCRNHPLSAPRADNDANGAISVEKAVEIWCQDNHGKDVGADGLYWRWGITKWGVPDRSSFWLRAAKTCDKPEKFNKEECKKALMDGMKECDKGSETHGLAASISCLDYSIDLSGVVHGGMPPWAEKKEDRRFPPPEFAGRKGANGQAHVPVCDKDENYRPLSEEDLSRAIDAFCKNGKEIKGYGEKWSNMFDYPPRNQPQFYNHEYYKMYLTMGAETINNGAKQPYDDMGWCKNYDWKMGKDDCTYALRKLFNTCSKDRKKNFIAGSYTYRCVTYKVFPVNIRTP